MEEELPRQRLFSLLEQNARLVDSARRRIRSGPLTIVGGPLENVEDVVFNLHHNGALPLCIERYNAHMERTAKHLGNREPNWRSWHKQRPKS